VSEINNILVIPDVTINTVAKHIRILSQNIVSPLDSDLQKISDSTSFSQKSESIKEWMFRKKLSLQDVSNITWKIRQHGFDSLQKFYVSNLESVDNSVNVKPTEKQLSLLKSLGVIGGVPETKQEVSEIIESILKNKPVTNQQREDLSKLGVSSSNMPKNYSDAKKMIWDVSHSVSQNTSHTNYSEDCDNYECDYGAELEYCNESAAEAVSQFYESMNCIGNEMDAEDLELAMEEVGNDAWETACGCVN
jgi:hypothetical protein